MVLESVAQMILIVVGAVIFIAALYWFFCCLLVRKSKWLPTRLDDVGWKKVDYIWIIIGSLALLIHFLKAGADIQIAERNLEEGFGRVAVQNLNIAATELSDSAICLPLTAPARKILSADNIAELDAACQQFSKIRPNSRASTEPDVRVIIYLVQNTASPQYSTPILVERVDALYRTWTHYSQQLDSIYQARGNVSSYEKVVGTFEYIASILLAIAIALRLAKVTGEISLKRSSAQSEDAIRTSSQDLDGASRELEKTAKELNVSAQELRHSTRIFSEAISPLANVRQFDALQTRLAKFERLMAHAPWILAVSVCIAVAIALLLQRALTAS